MLKKLSTLVAAGAFVALLAPAANAITPAPLGTSTDVIQVAGGCGPGWHRGPYGGCRRNAVVYGYGAPVVVRPAVVCRTYWNGYRRVRVCR